MSKKVSRIPQSRIPIPGLQSSGQIQIISELSDNDLGKRVRVLDEDGTLRYIGTTNFAPGVWCGIELSSATGKHDGCVRGKRYFACREGHGLMIQSTKVRLIENVNREDVDVTSGPHSTLFGINPQQVVNVNKKSSKLEKRKPTPSLIRSDTYERLTDLSTTHVLQDATQPENKPSDDSVSNILSATFKVTSNSSSTQNCTFNIKNNNFSHTTTIFTKIEQEEASCSSSSSYHENNYPDVVNSTRKLLDRSNDNSNSTKIIDLNITKQLAKYQDVGRQHDTFTLSSKKSPPSQVNDTIVKNTSETTLTNVSNPRYSDDFASLALQNQNSHSTPILNNLNKLENSPIRRLKHPVVLFSNDFEDDGTKRDSMECDESLGILTPEEMIDVSCFATTENQQVINSDVQNIILKFQADEKVTSDLASPNFVDASLKDFSLGIIDENMLSNFTLTSETTMNLELPLDSVDCKAKDYIVTRLEQTPSPEELPLDPIPVIESETKTEPTKSKTNSSFITSITSITSLDTGYQGDGEMSRPASRGPDHSPLTRRPIQRPLPRRPEPMTDSDFYTESDADNHEEHVLRGGRLARVIDGTLYGVDRQAATDIYVNNRENMDSSGIFTDIEGNTRADDLSSAESNKNKSGNVDTSPSPSDTSSKTISNDSQNASAIINNTFVKSEVNNNPKIIETNQIIIKETPTRTKHIPREESTLKKHKLPKRNVVSKVKADIEINNQQNNKENTRNFVKKAPGRWDAVMNKISKTPNDKSNLKEIKSKVASSYSSTQNRINGSPKTSTIKLRRTRVRAETGSKNDVHESLNSSASDLSGLSSSKRIIGSSKKRGDVVRVTQVLTATKLSPRSSPNIIIKNKKNIPEKIINNDIVKPTNRKTPFSNSHVKKPIITTKDTGKATVKGGRVSPGARPPQQNRAPIISTPKTVEALAVIIQHLAFNLEAFRTPLLKRQLEKKRHEIEEARFSCKQMEDKLNSVSEEYVITLEDEKRRFASEVEKLIQVQERQLEDLNEAHAENVKYVTDQHEKQLQLIQNEQYIRLDEECNKLQNIHLQSLDILREENDSIREEIDEKNVLIENLEKHIKHSEQLEKECLAKDLQHKSEIEALNKKISSLQNENEKYRMFNNCDRKGSNNTMAEVDSLKAVLELKQKEILELRRALADANQKKEMLPMVIEKVSSLSAKCEDLKSQLELKSSCENKLLENNDKLQESLKKELYERERLARTNEELQWKLRQNKEVLTCVIEQTDGCTLNRSNLSSSFSERRGSPRHFERTMSFRERSGSNSYFNDISGTKKINNVSELEVQFASPNVKSVIKKSDSVSYLLDLEDSPDTKAKRIVRRSFRNLANNNGSSNKRPRMRKNPLSLSASVGAIVPSNTPNHMRSHSLSIRDTDTGSVSSASDDVFTWPTVASAHTSTPNGYAKHRSFQSINTCIDDANDLDGFNHIKLPVLPSEIGRNSNAQPLPVPKHLAGEAMISESNSEDESTTSSSSAQL